MTIPNQPKPDNSPDKDKTTSVRYRHMFNFRKIWWVNFLLTSAFAIGPLFFFALIDYNVTRKSVESEAIMRLSRFASNSWRSISYFLDKQKSALVFAVQDNTYETLVDVNRLQELLQHLKEGFGDYTDLSVIDCDGKQVAYVGPYNLAGKNYTDQEWFNEVVQNGAYISDVVLGFRQVPHLVIAIRHFTRDGDFFVLRATFEHQFSDMLADMEADVRKDVFLLNQRGVIQTSSRFFGEVFETIAVDVPPFYEKTNVADLPDVNGKPIIAAYRYIPETPFIFMVAMSRKELMAPWYTPRLSLIGYLMASITVVLLWIIGVTSYMVRKLKVTDKRRIRNLHMAEFSNKMASIGRLAAGVAHEINNPLAVINEKAGLVKDMFEFKEEYKYDPKLLKAIDSIIASVDRCSRITRRLLGFARHMDVSIQAVNLKELITEVMGFLEKEALYRSIDVKMDIPDDLPIIESDRGKLQQIFLNILNNAFAALSDGGFLHIAVMHMADGKVGIQVEDNGYGISPENLKRIFEPFFSTKTKKGGTGLGLAITYGLVQEIGGTIDVDSEEGKGTCFTISLPLTVNVEKRTHVQLEPDSEDS